jgi:starch synthase (maltosyl-transferring)
VKYYLAKLGFTQSYSYFPWRNTAEEIRAYFTELTRTPVREFFRPSLWPNTPDILPEALQIGGRPAFVIRFILAATLGPSYGIYGPAYELCVNTPLNPGGEEYMDSEKYQLKAWELNRPESLRPLIERVNRIRRENRALHSNDFLAFHEVDNPQIIAYSKRTRDLQNIVLVIVNLDPHNAQEGSVELDLDELGIRGSETFETHDLLTGARACWRGTSQRVRFEPLLSSAAIYRLRRRVSAEDDFEYFL